MPQDGAGFGFVYTAHPAAHIAIPGGGYDAADGPKDKPDVELCFNGALNTVLKDEMAKKDYIWAETKPFITD